MILSYRDAMTERFACGERIKQFEPVRRLAENRLMRLEAAVSLFDLAALPGNALEKLSGHRKGQWGIRITEHWRICFIWEDGALGPSDVEIVDFR